MQKEILERTLQKIQKKDETLINVSAEKLDLRRRPNCQSSNSRPHAFPVFLIAPTLIQGQNARKKLEELEKLQSTRRRWVILALIGSRQYEMIRILRVTSLEAACCIPFGVKKSHFAFLSAVH
jgi:hypothetical protein